MGCCGTCCASSFTECPAGPDQQSTDIVLGPDIDTMDRFLSSFLNLYFYLVLASREREEVFSFIILSSILFYSNAHRLVILKCPWTFIK